MNSAAATAIDLQPILNLVVWPVLGALGMALAGLITARVNQWLGLKNNAFLQATLEKAIQSGLQAAQARVATMNIQHVDVQSKILADASTYVLSHVPDTLKAAGIDVSTPAGAMELAEKLEARLAPAIMVAVSSPTDVSVATAATIANPDTTVTASAAMAATPPDNSAVPGAPITHPKTF